MLTRSSYGLQNISRFFKVDYVLYTEGGSSKSLQDIDHKDNYDHGFDASFWSGVVKNFKPGAKFRVNSVGSKSVLLEISKKIIDDSIDNIIVAMDKDHDDLLGSKIEHPRVVYTHGYSWENDIVNELGINDLFHILCPTSRLADVTTEFLDFQRSVESELNRAAYADYVSIRIGEGVFNRRKPEEFVSTDSDGFPTLDVARFRKRIADIKKKYLAKSRPGHKGRFDYRRDMFGKTFATFAYRWLIARCKQIKKVTLDKSVFFGCLIGTFLRSILTNDEHPITRHFASQFQRF